MGGLDILGGGPPAPAMPSGGGMPPGLPLGTPPPIGPLTLGFQKNGVQAREGGGRPAEGVLEGTFSLPAAAHHNSLRSSHTRLSPASPLPGFLVGSPRLLLTRLLRFASPRSFFFAQVTFLVSKIPGQPPSTSLVTGQYSNASPAPVTDFLLQAAVPKFMTLTMGPATGTALPPGNSGAVTQTITVNNTQYGAKPLVMRLKISYTQGGVPMNEEVTVNTFPAAA